TCEWLGNQPVSCRATDYERRSYSAIIKGVDHRCFEGALLGLSRQRQTTIRIWILIINCRRYGSRVERNRRSAKLHNAGSTETLTNHRFDCADANILESGLKNLLYGRALDFIFVGR